MSKTTKILKMNSQVIEERPTTKESSQEEMEAGIEYILSNYEIQKALQGLRTRIYYHESIVKFEKGEKFESKVFRAMQRLSTDVGIVLKEARQQNLIQKFTKKAESKNGDAESCLKKRQTVTNADLVSHQEIVNSLSFSLPHTNIISEEGTINTEYSDGYKLVIDPLDGTNLYLEGNDMYSINIGLFDPDGILVASTVYFPETNSSRSFNPITKTANFDPGSLELSALDHQVEAIGNRRIPLDENGKFDGTILTPEKDFPGAANEALLMFLLDDNIQFYVTQGKEDWDVIGLLSLAEDPRFKLEEREVDGVKVVIVTRVNCNLEKTKI
jgi:hypothetical protein